MFQAQPRQKKRKEINLTQGSPKNKGFKKGYQSFVTDSRTPLDALSDMTNITLEQDNLPRPRPSLVLFGEQPLGTMIGVATYVDTTTGLPVSYDISMQVIGGVGKIHTRKDGDTWVAATGAGNTYDQTAVVNFCQSNSRVYISNGVDTLSYYDIATDNIETYSAISSPSTPTATGTGLTGSNYTYYYRVTANNLVGESAASTAGSVAVSTPRESWTPASQFVTLTWSAIAEADANTTYSIYVGTLTSEGEKLLTTTTGLTFKDDGTITLNTFVRAPEGNSTEGPVLTYMWNKDGQLYGVGDTTNPDYLWYDGGSAIGGSGNFSPFEGGGNVGINTGGDTVPVVVRAFRTGKGEPAVTVLSKGVAGVGKMHHLVFIQTVFDTNQIIQVPNITEANGQAGTIAPRAVLEANNSLWYWTGQDCKSTGTSANVQNILSTNSVTNDIIPDVRNLNNAAMGNACGVTFEDKLFFALPVASSTNNQVWVKDLSRGGVWVMPWIIRADFMWLSEDNVTGEISHCIYDGTNILKFSRSVYHQDNGVAFRSRAAHEGIVWSDSGMTMAAIQELRMKFLQPSGTIGTNAFGLNEDGAVDTLATDTFTQTASFTGWNSLMWSDGELPSLYSGEVGVINFTSTGVNVVTLEIDETVNQLGWEVVCDTADADYLLSTTHTNGIEIPRSYFGS
jgi:hypothetical protein